MARILLEHNADPNALDHQGYTPLHIALMYGHLDMVRLLLELDVDVNTWAKGSTMPLHRASEWGQLEVARMLLEHDADVKAEDDEGNTALQLASEYGRCEIVRLLSEHGAKHGGTHSSRSVIYRSTPRVIPEHMNPTSRFLLLYLTIHRQLPIYHSEIHGI